VAAENLVGRGGYAEVYMGVLADGRAIAVKRLAPALADGKREKEFLTELGTVGHVNHPNVSRLLGCCVENGLHLIFELSARGSVSSNLHGTSFYNFFYTLRKKRESIIFLLSLH
jgi:serine/threonine protein kinase